MSQSVTFIFKSIIFNIIIKSKFRISLNLYQAKIRVF